MNIKVSPKHGLNPSIPICFWCGNEKNEIAILGKIDKEDSEAPRRVLMDYCPCDKCKELFKDNIHIIGVSSFPSMEGMPPIYKDGNNTLYPTSNFLVVTKECIVRMLSSQEETKDMIENVLNSGKLLLDDKIVLSLIHETE